MIIFLTTIISSFPKKKSMFLNTFNNDKLIILRSEIVKTKIDFKLFAITKLML